MTYVAPLFSSNGETVAIIPEVVVRVKPGIGMEEVQTLCQSAGCTITKRMEFTEQEYLLEVLGLDAEVVFAAVQQLGQALEIEWAFPNTACRPKVCGQSSPTVLPSSGQLRIVSEGEDDNVPGVFPNDPYFSLQWHLHNTGQSGGTPGADIRAPEAWEITTGDPNVMIAVLDCGVDLDHPDLINNLVPGYDFLEGDDWPEPTDDWDVAHGTACAGLLAAQGDNGIGVIGVVWNCKIMPIRLYNYTSICTQADLATAFRWAAAHGADVLSNSWWWGRNPTPILQSGISDVSEVGSIGRDGKGCVVLFGAGNQSGSPEYPVKYPEVISVGATDPCDNRWQYSNFGTELDITAPSGCWTNHCVVPTPMWTTDIAGPSGWDEYNLLDVNILDYTDSMGGTSGACPLAAGVAALILSIEPNLTSDEVRHFLERSAKDLGDPGRDDYYGWGRIDARAALDMVLAKRADLNDDWQVDEQDLAILNTAIEVNDLAADVAPAKKRDGIVDEQDVELLTRYLGTVIPELGLIAHWKLDETEGMVAHDSEGKANATVMGGALWQPQGGKVGGALQLTGTANFLTAKLPRNPSEGPMSIFVWVKGGKPGQAIVSQAGGANWLMADAATGALATDLSAVARGGKALVSQTVITDGAWHRVGLVWDGSDRILYVDDVEVARDTQPSLAGSAANLTIGAGSTFAPGTYWSGLIDDVRIYDRAVAP